MTTTTVITRRDLPTEGVAIVDSGTPEKAMRFLAGWYHENPDEMDSSPELRVWAQIPASLCAELVAMALGRTPARYNEDRTLAEIVYVRGQADPDAADWHSLEVPNAAKHLADIRRQERQQPPAEREEILDTEALLPDRYESLELDDDLVELEALREVGLISNLHAIRPIHHTPLDA